MLVELRATIVRRYVRGYLIEGSTPAPSRVRLYDITAGDYFTCGVLAEKSLRPVCWGSGLPSQLPLAISLGLCRPNPCMPGFYEFNNGSAACKSGYQICLLCSNSYPTEMYQKSMCTSISDRQCGYNCSGCVSDKCLSGCSDVNPTTEKKDEKYWSLQLPVIIAEVAFAVLLSSIVSLTAILYIRYKLRNCRCSAKVLKPKKNNGSSSQKDCGKVQPDLEEIKIRRAQLFTYEELENATRGFKEESQMGKGSGTKGSITFGLTLLTYIWQSFSGSQLYLKHHNSLCLKWIFYLLSNLL